MLLVIFGILLHIALVWAALEFIETQWPTLHRLIRAAIISTLIALVVSIFHSWICSWLCRA
jgi:hypothetical protein